LIYIKDYFHVCRHAWKMPTKMFLVVLIWWLDLQDFYFFPYNCIYIYIYIQDLGCEQACGRLYQLNLSPRTWVCKWRTRYMYMYMYNVLYGEHLIRKVGRNKTKEMTASQVGKVTPKLSHECLIGFRFQLLYSLTVCF
jgi:hypothetical protein